MEDRGRVGGFGRHAELDAHDSNNLPAGLARQRGGGNGLGMGKGLGGLGDKGLGGLGDKGLGGLGDKGLGGLSATGLAGGEGLGGLGDAGLGGGAEHGLHHTHAVHEQLNRHHMHLPNGGGRHGSGAGLIWLLVFLHLGFIAYWMWVYYKQQRARAKKEGKKEPERVNCVYEFALPTINLPGLGVGQGEKVP